MDNAEFSGSCPLPIQRHGTVQLGHGSGGRMMNDLIQEIFLSTFDNEILSRREDQAVLEAGGARLAFSTDSFVVDPIEFPGGDIGCLAGPRHRERRGDERRQAAVLERRFHHRGRFPPGGSAADRPVDAVGRPGSRCRHRHRRHQGGEQGSVRQAVHQHRRHRAPGPAVRTGCATDPGRRSPPGQRDRR